MFEFHGWFALAETPGEIDAGGLEGSLEELQELLVSLSWPTATNEMRWLNGQPFLAMQGLVNRRRHEAEDIERTLSLVCRRLPGSYGLLFHRSEDMDVPPGAGAFAVTVMARGNLERRLDPFLSPTQPVVED